MTKRIRDISYEASCLTKVFCCGRGTIVMHSADATHPECRLTTRHAKPLFRKIKESVAGNQAHATYVD